MRYVSDIDETTDGRFSVEWDDEMGTYWETFDTEKARDLALQANEDYIKLHRSEYLEDRRWNLINTLELNLNMIDDDMGYLLNDRELALAERYRDWTYNKYIRDNDGYPISELVSV